MSAPVRYVLARAAEQGFFEAVAPNLAPFDPLRRGAIRRAARDAFALASTSTRVTDEGHVLRLAFLQTGPRPPADPNDVDAVRQAFEAERVLFPKRGMAFWPVTFTFVLVVLVGSAVTAFLVWLPSPSERFARSAFGEAMGDGLTDWTVGVGRHDFARQEKARDVILRRSVKRQIGENAFNLLGTSLDQSKALKAALSPADVEREQRGLTTTLHALAAELASRKVPGFIDAYVDGGDTAFGSDARVWLLGYHVDDRATITLDGATVPMLEGRRLDNLNLEVGGKAYESKVLGGWVMSLDEVDHWVIGTVVPALGKGRGFGFGSERIPTEGSEGRLATKVGERLRGELLGLAGMSEDEGSELADLLSQRHAAFLHLATLGDELFEPRGLRAKSKLRQSLARRRESEMDAAEIVRIDDKLVHLEKPFAVLVRAQTHLDEIRIAVDVVTTQAKLEVADSVTEKFIPASVASHLTMVARAETPFLALAEAEMGSGGYATWWLIERELGLSPEWLTALGVNDEAEHGQLGVAMFDKPVDAIRKAAEAAFLKVFGKPMPAVHR